MCVKRYETSGSGDAHDGGPQEYDMRHIEPGSCNAAAEEGRRARFGKQPRFCRIRSGLKGARMLVLSAKSVVPEGLEPTLSRRG